MDSVGSVVEGGASPLSVSFVGEVKISKRGFFFLSPRPGGNCVPRRRYFSNFTSLFPKTPTPSSHLLFCPPNQYIVLLLLGSIQAWEFNVWHGCIDIFSFTHCPSAGFRSHRISSHFHPYPHPYPTPTWLFFPIVSVLSGCPGADVQPKTRGRRQNFIPFNGTVTAPGQSCLLAIVARR